MTDAPAPEPAADSRGLRVALLLLAVAAGLLFVGYAGTWASAVVTQPGLPTLEVSLTGREVQPAGAAAAVLALAAIAGLVALRRVGRAVSGVLLVLTGLLAAGGALAFGLGSRESARRLVSERAGVDVDVELVVTLWWTAAVAGGVLLAVVGVLAVVRGGRWPALGRRYERTPASAAGAPGASGASGASGEERRPAAAESAWDQLDRGVDPTDGPDDTPGPDPAQVARADAAADRMSGTDPQEDPR